MAVTADELKNSNPACWGWGIDQNYLNYMEGVTKDLESGEYAAGQPQRQNHSPVET